MLKLGIIQNEDYHIDWSNSILSIFLVFPIKNTACKKTRCN